MTGLTPAVTVGDHAADAVGLRRQPVQRPATTSSSATTPPPTCFRSTRSTRRRPTTRPTPGTHHAQGARAATWSRPARRPRWAIGAPVFKAATYSFFVGSASAGTYANMLLVDPNGMASTQHLDYGNTVQPAVEGVVDFQVAVGNDANANGTINESARPAPTSGSATPAARPSPAPRAARCRRRCARCA